MLRTAFSGLLRRSKPKPYASSLPGARLTLLDQSALPAPLRLPRPGEPLARICAGLADAGLALASGACAACALHYGGGLALEAAALPAQSVALLAWAARDALGAGRNRSPGKALFGLELANADGSLASPAAALLRSSYMLLLPATPLHPFVGLGLELLLFFDLATVVLTQDARKAGDYMWGCRVVEERPGRAERLLEYREAEEMAALRARIEAAAPGLLRAEGLAEEATWHTAPVAAPLPPPAFGAGQRK
jgi:uncharacterized RDD family membrane protein YckC